MIRGRAYHHVLKAAQERGLTLAFGEFGTIAVVSLPEAMIGICLNRFPNASQAYRFVMTHDKESPLSREEIDRIISDMV
jgi:hypothetical protein